MKKFLRYSLSALFLCAAVLNAQTTTVSGTVIDSGGVTWIGGTISYVFSPSPNNVGLPTIWNGSALPTNYFTPTTVTLSNTGTFSFSLPSNNYITPINSQWKFTVCPLATATCQNVLIYITGATQNITAPLTAVMPALTITGITIPNAYASTQIASTYGLGTLYYNTTSNSYLYWSGSAWTALSTGTGAAGGDLCGTYPNPTVCGINGATIATWLTNSLSSAPAWLRYYGDGSSGALNLTSGTLSLEGEYDYTSVNISSGATVYDGGGIPLFIRSTGTCTIAGTFSASANTSGSGNSGGAIGGGGGGGGGGGTLAGSNGSSSPAWAGASGGVALGGNASNGSTLNTAFTKSVQSSGPITFYSTASYSSYGGTAGGAGGSSGGAAGKGGGLLVLVCPTINFTGTLDVSGTNGGASTGNNIGAGGGGGGGLIWMAAQTFTANTGTLNVSGGTGGSCGAFTGCGTGGTGAPGLAKQFQIQ